MREGVSEPRHGDRIHHGVGQRDVRLQHVPRSRSLRRSRARRGAGDLDLAHAPGTPLVHGPFRCSHAGILRPARPRRFRLSPDVRDADHRVDLRLAIGVSLGSYQARRLPISVLPRLVLLRSGRCEVELWSRTQLAPGEPTVEPCGNELLPRLAWILQRGNLYPDSSWRESHERDQRRLHALRRRAGRHRADVPCRRGSPATTGLRQLSFTLGSSRSRGSSSGNGS